MGKSISLEELQNMNFDDGEAPVSDRERYRNYSKDIAATLAYLMGVKEESLAFIPDAPEDYTRVIENGAAQNESARAIRHLNSIRSNLILRFKEVSRKIRVTSSDYTPLYKMEYFEEDIKALKKLGIDISTGRSDLTEYLNLINDEIKKRLDRVRELFPEWVDFGHIKNAFIMPKNTEVESKKFLANQDCYPYKRYFNWNKPEPMGNILICDEKALEIIYLSDGDFFTESNKVVGASAQVKDNINAFLQLGNKVQIFIDGENTDPYKFAAALDSLTDEELDKIEKIVVYYDAKYSTRAWEMLHHFSCGIEVEAHAVERLLDNKSLVDHKLAIGVTTAVIGNRVDSIILCSSDSDFWSIMEDVNARYLVMAELEKCGGDFKEVLREHDIFYCYLDRFKVPEDNLFFKTVFRKELQSKLDETINSLGVEAKQLLQDAVTESRAWLSPQEWKNLRRTYIDGLKLEIIDGKLTVVVPE